MVSSIDHIVVIVARIRAAYLLYYFLKYTLSGIGDAAAGPHKRVCTLAFDIEHIYLYVTGLLLMPRARR